MLWKHLAAAAGLAVATTDAFLVVPDASTADNDIVSALPVHDSSAALDSQTLTLDCPGCPVKLRRPGSSATIYATNVESHLELTFSVDATTGPFDRLLVNDFELYPSTGSWYKTLRAPQVPDLSSGSEAAEVVKTQGWIADPSSSHQLGYALGIRPVAAPEETEGDPQQELRLIEIDLQVLEVGFSFVDDIPAVQLRLVETPSGKLMLGSLEKIQPEPETSYPAKDQEGNGAVQGEETKCETVFCSWRNSVVKGLKSLRPSCAHGSKANHDANRHKYMQGHYKHRHTWSRLLKNITWSIFLPILIGLVAGVSVAIMGMAFGTLLICLWRLAFRRQTPWMHRRCRRRGGHRAPCNETSVVEEKAGLMDNQEEDVAGLPPYVEDEEKKQSSTQS